VCGQRPSVDDAHGHVVFPSRLQDRIVAIVSKRLASRDIGAYPLIQSSAARRRGLPRSADSPSCATMHRTSPRWTVRVPTIGFGLLYVLAIIRLGRRQLVWIKVTPNPPAEWIAHQITEAFPWNEASRYLIRDRD
jgi:hypothetical protein